MTKGRTPHIYPSILAADFAHLAQEVAKAEKALADGIHIDVMDGHFVPNLSMGPAVCAAINRNTPLFLDVHLMIYNPFDYIERFVEAGADRLTFHLEATEDVSDLIDYIKRCGVEVAVAINPDTPESLLFKYLDRLDGVLLMTVEPGFGGQSFIEGVLDKVKVIKEANNHLGLNLAISVDGGIDPSNIGSCFEAGATDFVVGTAFYKAPDFSQVMASLREALKSR